MRQTHVITPVFHVLFLGQLVIIHSEAAEGSVVCSAAMGRLDSLLLEDSFSLLLEMSKARVLPWLHMEQALLWAVPPLLTAEDGDGGEVQYSSLAHAQRFTATGTVSL